MLVVADGERHAEHLGALGQCRRNGARWCRDAVRRHSVNIPRSVAIDPDFWRGRRVLLTGHTGFKGSWLTLWLSSLGAEVTGLAPEGEPAGWLYERARAGEGVSERAVDVRDGRALAQAVDEAEPEVVVHLAAQPLVRRSLREPVATYEVNVMGTVNLLEAVRARRRAPHLCRRRHIGQVLREPGPAAPPVHRGRSAGRQRPVFQLEGMRRARRHRVPALVRRSGRSGRPHRERPRRQRHRRRRSLRGPPAPRRAPRGRVGRARCSSATPAPCGPGSTCSVRSRGT